MTPPPVLHVEVDGRGTPLLLLHGFGGSARNFRPQVRALRDRYRVVTCDLRGHARSEAPADARHYALECHVDDVERVLDAQGAERAFVGGLSLGAAITLHFALAHPARVRGLVLASFPGAGGLQRSATRFAEAVEHDGLEAAGARFVWGPDSGLDAETAGFVRRGFLEHAPHAVAHGLRALVAKLPAAADLAPALRELRTPALLVAGARDPASLEASRVLAHALPGAERVVIEDAGHVVNLARPRAFDAALLDFLDRCAEEETR